MATHGAGAGLLQSATATTITNPVAVAVANAGFTSLVTKASISLINNKGDLGGVFDDLTSSRAARAFATSVLVAGLTAGVTTELGVDTGSTDIVDRIRTNLVEAGVGTAVDVTLSGADFGDSLLDHLAFAAVDTVGAAGARLIGDAHRKGDIEGPDPLPGPCRPRLRHRRRQRRVPRRRNRRRRGRGRGRALRRHLPARADRCP